MLPPNILNPPPYRIICLAPLFMSWFASAQKTPSGPILDQLPALGRNVRLGELYDSTTESFLGMTVFHSSLLVHHDALDAVYETDIDSTRTKLDTVTSEREKIFLIDATVALTIGFYCDLIEVEGSAGFLKNRQSSSDSKSSVMVHSMRTKRESVQLFYDSLLSIYSQQVLENPLLNATHIVVAVEYGADVIVNFEESETTRRENMDIFGKLAVYMRKFEAYAKTEISAKIGYGDLDWANRTQLSIRIFGDLSFGNDYPQNLAEVIAYMRTVPKLIKESNQGRGKKMAYTLFPINILRKKLKINAGMASEHADRARELTPANSNLLIALKEENEEMELKLNEWLETMRDHVLCLGQWELDRITRVQNNFVQGNARFKQKLQKIVIAVRSARVAESVLENLVRNYEQEDFSIQNLKSWMSQFEKEMTSQVKLCQLFVNISGVEFLHQREQSKTKLTELLMRYESKVVQVFFYSTVWRQDRNWDERLNFFAQLKTTWTQLAVVNCDGEPADVVSLCEGVNGISIWQYVRMKLVSRNVFEDFEETRKNIGLTRELKLSGVKEKERRKLGALYSVSRSSFYTLSKSVLTLFTDKVVKTVVGSQFHTRFKIVNLGTRVDLGGKFKAIYDNMMTDSQQTIGLSLNFAGELQSNISSDVFSKTRQKTSEEGERLSDRKINFFATLTSSKRNTEKFIQLDGMYLLRALKSFPSIPQSIFDGSVSHFVHKIIYEGQGKVQLKFEGIQQRDESLFVKIVEEVETFFNSRNNNFLFSPFGNTTKGFNSNNNNKLPCQSVTAQYSKGTSVLNQDDSAYYSCAKNSFLKLGPWLQKIRSKWNLDSLDALSTNSLPSVYILSPFKAMEKTFGFSVPNPSTFKPVDDESNEFFLRRRQLTEKLQIVEKSRVEMEDFGLKLETNQCVVRHDEMMRAQTLRNKLEQQTNYLRLEIENTLVGNRRWNEESASRPVDESKHKEEMDLNLNIQFSAILTRILVLQWAKQEQVELVCSNDPGLTHIFASQTRRPIKILCLHIDKDEENDFEKIQKKIVDSFSGLRRPGTEESGHGERNVLVICNIFRGGADYNVSGCDKRKSGSIQMYKYDRLVGRRGSELANQREPKFMNTHIRNLIEKVKENLQVKVKTLESYWRGRIKTDKMQN